VGYFHANERSDESELGSVAKNIGDHICRYFPQAAVLLVCCCIFFFFGFANLLLNLFLVFAIFGSNYLLLLIIFLFLFNCLQLDNKKLDALKKSKEGSAIMQVSDFSVGNRICHDR